MKELDGKRVWFCSNVGGGIFGELQVSAWRALGVNARLHSAVPLREYWRAKSNTPSLIRLRWNMYARYTLMLWNAVRQGGRADVYVAVTNPFFLPAIAARAARNTGAKVINLVYDLYPDALIYGGGWSAAGLPSRIAAASTRRAIRNCDATVYLGSRLRAHAETVYGCAKCSEVIPVGSDITPFENNMPQQRSTREIACLYSGHMGRLHDWRTLAEALLGGVPQSIKVEIAADGPGVISLRKCIPEGSLGGALIYAGTRHSAQWKLAMLAADVALVTMVPGAEKVVMPSKTYSAMAAGQAILAVCSKNSDLADTVLNHECGWVVEPGDIAGFRALLESLPARSDDVLVKRRNSYAAARKYYSMQAIGMQWAALFNTL